MWVWPLRILNTDKNKSETPHVVSCKKTKVMKTRIKNLLPLLLLLGLPAVVQAQVNYAVSGNTAYVTTSPNASGDIVISNTYEGYPVTSIGDDALAGSGLTSVTIPDSVTSIGDYAFYDCISLTSVTIPNNATSIGEATFDGCSGLTSVTIGNGVTSIEFDAFQDCTRLTNVTIGSSVTTIENGAFDGCTNLTSVTIPDSVTNLGAGAFSFCSGLTSVTIPNSVTSIGYEAFAYCYGLHQAYFQGNAPGAVSDVFLYDSGTVYYYAGTTGWGSYYGGWPTVELFAPPKIGGGGIGIQSGNFGFTITGVSNQTVVVEASTNLLNWQVIQTITLSGTSTNFTDPQWTNYPERFYRVTSAFTVGGTLTGLPAGDTVTLQDNGSDDLTLSNNGTFTFPTALPSGQSYSVTVSGTSGGTSILTEIDWPPVTANGSGTISGANVTNVVVQCMPLITGDRDLDMYNAAVADGTAHGGVPGVMPTENGGPFRVTALGNNSVDVAYYYSSWAVFTTVVGSTSCSATAFPSGTQVIQFGSSLECGSGGPFGY